MKKIKIHEFPVCEFSFEGKEKQFKMFYQICKIEKKFWKYAILRSLPTAMVIAKL